MHRTTRLPQDAAQAAARAANDDRLAAGLCRAGLAAFVSRWYQQPLWAPLRRHPAFPRMLARRTAAAAAEDAGGHAAAAAAPEEEGKKAEVEQLTQSAAVQAAAALSGMSTGRMVSCVGLELCFSRLVV